MAIKKIKTKKKLTKTTKVKKVAKLSARHLSSVRVKKSTPEKVKIKSKTKSKAKSKISKKSKVGLKIKKIIKKVVPTKLIKPAHNPIISPSYYPWETKATFNPAAIFANGKVYILYRAIGNDDSSTLGYASSFDGLHVVDRPTYSVYKRYMNKTDYSQPSVEYVSGGGWSGGCEDPRLSLIDNVLYMIYTAFDGWGSVRIALTSISLEDFRKKKWNWKKPVLISPPGEIHKNWVLFPRKINGKYAILHSISPNILIDYLDSLDELNGEKFIKSHYNSKPNWDITWDNIVRGVGPTPIETDLGWLILYHSMDRNDPDRYKLGAMILDYKDPTKILYKLSNPILEPEEDYENNGHKWGVIYSCGAVVKDGELFVYYGGADKFVCVASMPLKELLEALKKNKTVKFKKGQQLESAQ